SEFQLNNLLKIEKSIYQTSNSPEIEELKNLEHQVNNLFEIEELEHHLNNLLKKSEQQADNSFTNFLEEIRIDYEKQDLQLCTALDKFSVYYEAAKSKSVPQLTSFLYNIKCNSNLWHALKYSKVMKENNSHNIPK
ncbi:1329_t:CDS:2, partial [Dentiscutata heterogama]